MRKNSNKTVTICLTNTHMVIVDFKGFKFLELTFLPAGFQTEKSSY